MIEFKNLHFEEPYIKFHNFYKAALQNNQNFIEAMSISSYSILKNEVDSRFVNLKLVDGDKFIFFSNYLSSKAKQFETHNQVSVLFFWDSIYCQIRMKGYIKKLPIIENKIYFQKRSRRKNALAISSNQSRVINSYDEIIKKYNDTLKNANLLECPDYWGGYSFVPYKIEFWEGKEYRLNKRNQYVSEANGWKHLILEP